MAVEPEQSPAEPEEQARRVPRLGFITVLAIFAGVVIVIIYGYLARPGWIGVSGKQFWDYLDLLIVPAALALGVYWLNRRQNERSQQAEEAQQERALAVENQRAQDEALQAYLDQMAQLLIEHPLRRASPGDNLSTVARARTLTVLTRVDGARKRTVLHFLSESGLIYSTRPVLSLSGAYLSKAYLVWANLSGAYLRRANLREAELFKANLNEADLFRADLSGADLSGANLRDANLRDASLAQADLTDDANLSRADLRGADLSSADLSSADLSSADLSSADLGRADDSGKVYLRGADGLFERGADLYTNLSGANLSKADLTYAKVTEEQLSQCESLEGATMPNGQKYEDWLKSKGNVS